MFNKNFIEMVSKLREFYDLVEENGWIFPGKKIQIDDLVEGFLVDWFDGLRAQIIIWVRKTLDSDNWVPLSKVHVAFFLSFSSRGKQIIIRMTYWNAMMCAFIYLSLSRTDNGSAIRTFTYRCF